MEQEPEFSNSYIATTGCSMMILAGLFMAVGTAIGPYCDTYECNAAVRDLLPYLEWGGLLSSGFLLTMAVYQWAPIHLDTNGIDQRTLEWTIGEWEE